MFPQSSTLVVIGASPRQKAMKRSRQYIKTGIFVFLITNPSFIVYSIKIIKIRIAKTDNIVMFPEIVIHFSKLFAVECHGNMMNSAQKNHINLLKFNFTEFFIASFHLSKISPPFNGQRGFLLAPEFYLVSFQFALFHCCISYNNI